MERYINRIEILEVSNGFIVNVNEGQNFLENTLDQLTYDLQNIIADQKGRATVNEIIPNGLDNTYSTVMLGRIETALKKARENRPNSQVLICNTKKELGEILEQIIIHKK